MSRVIKVKTLQVSFILSLKKLLTLFIFTSDGSKIETLCIGIFAYICICHSAKIIIYQTIANHLFCRSSSLNMAPPARCIDSKHVHSSTRRDKDLSTHSYKTNIKQEALSLQTRTLGHRKVKPFPRVKQIRTSGAGM